VCLFARAGRQSDGALTEIVMTNRVCHGVARLRLRGTPRGRRSLYAPALLVGLVLGLPAPGAGQALAATAPAPETLTIEQAVREALAHNLDLIAKRADVTVTEAQMLTADLRPNPVISLDANHLDWLGTGFNDVNQGGPTEFGVRVDVPFERGKKRDLRMDEASAARSVAEAQVAEAIRTLRSTVELACVDVIQASENLALTRDTLRTFADLAALNEERVRAGAAAPSEATRTQVAMLQFRANVSRAELDLRTASIRLRQLVGRPSSSGPLEVVGPPIAAQPPLASSLALFQALALEHRTDLQAAHLAQARSAADLRLQAAIGKIDFTWGAEYRRQAGPTSMSNSIGLFFSAPIPLSSRNQGEIARAEAEQNQAQLQIAALQESISADVRSAFEAYEASAALVASIEHDLLGPAQSARDTAEYTYRAHATTLVELIDSQRAWNDAMQAYHDAQADYRRAVSRLNAAVGTEVVR
jgi:cobalt-zinc-cadmium efflux system outer membrane protein